MELLSYDFLLALGAIVVIDLLLAGDNAIVIALAARNLPPDMRQRAVLWGTVGAVAVRTVMTLVVVWLLRLPGLLLLGGLMLVWIAYQLLVPEQDDGNHPGISPAASFWGAMRTVVVADLVMGLDNVLAVAGAAQGSFLLVVLGLLISVPIMVFGSTLLLRYVERYPWLIYLGAGVLAWTAAKMISHEPLLAEVVSDAGWLTGVFQMAVVLAVLAAGLMRNHRRLESRIASRLASMSAARQVSQADLDSCAGGGQSMLKILVPIDGSLSARHAVHYAIRQFATNRKLEIHLLNVQTPLSRAVAQFVRRRDREAWHREQADRVLRPIRAMLAAAGVPYVAHVERGREAETIVALARRLDCDHIVMGTARQNSLTRMLEASVTNRVLELTTVPVEVIAGEDVSRLERYGIPVGIGGMLTLLLLAAAD